MILPQSMINRYWSFHQSKLPDHYALRFTFNYNTISCDENDPISNVYPQFTTKIYKLKRIPGDFLSSELTRSALIQIIRNIELCRESKENIDAIYDTFCSTLIQEMNDNIIV